VTIPTQIPASLIAGDTWRWTLALAGYDAQTWTAVVYFTNAGDVFNATATADGTSHAFSIPAATTADYKAGRYAWTVRVTSGAIVETALTGSVEVTPDPTVKRDTRSNARITLEAVQCFLRGNATTAQASMTLKDRSVSRWSLAELLQWEKDLKAQVRTEEAAATGGLGRDIRVRFGRG
jgi:hypothetical protein